MTETRRSTCQVGHAGLPGRTATQALSTSIVVDMCPKAVRGMPAEDAVRWAAAELRTIYGA